MTYIGLAITRKSAKPADDKEAPGGVVERGPYKFTDAVKTQYLQELRNGKRRCAAARAVGVNPHTIAIYRRNDAEFEALAREAEFEGDEEVEDALRTAAISGNVAACFGWLYSRQPERWSDRRTVKTEITGADGGPILYADLTDKPDDLLIAEAESITRRAAEVGSPRSGVAAARVRKDARKS